MIFDEAMSKTKDDVSGKQIILSSRHIKSIIPVWSEDYKGSVCWHGCDKISRLGKDGSIGGGGGS